MRWLLFVALVGCAQAGQPGFEQHGDGGIHVIDSSGTTVDAYVRPDGGGSGSGSGSGGGPHTLSETTGTDDTGIGIACGDGQTSTERTNYYRVFPLSSFGISGTFHVTNVDFLVSTAAAGPSLKVSVGTYSGTPGGGTLTATDIALTANQTVTPADTTTAQNQDVPITADVTGNLVVEVAQTNKGSSSNGITFYIGANGEGESAPGYISSSDCSLTTPTSMTQQAGGETDLVLTVTGTN